MIYGNIENKDTFDQLLGKKVWDKAFNFLLTLPENPPLGITKLDGDDMFVNVMKYDTLPRGECQFETHIKYIDLQYTIAGCESMDVINRGQLDPKDSYDAGRDLQFYKDPGVIDCSNIVMNPKNFVILLPHEAHRPKIQVPPSLDIFKLVIKINVKLTK